GQERQHGGGLRVRARRARRQPARPAKRCIVCFRPNTAVVLDIPRLYRVEHNRASISTLAGRTKVELNIGGVQRRQLATAEKLGEADLVQDHKGRWRLLVSAHYADPPVIQTEGALGVDLGRTDIAATSDG